jgi:hypothetical protein
MSVSDEALRAATEIVLTWGPERGVPEPDRLRQKFPNLSDAEIQFALQEGHRVLSEATALAEGIKVGTIPKSGNQTLRDSRPWLTESLAGSAINQGLYFHWRETGM